MKHPETVLRTVALSKAYGRTLALDGLDLEVPAGRVLGFLGPNGAGKTTTLRLLTGYLKPTAGRAFVAGHDAWTDRVLAHRQLGYLPGDLRLWPKLTGEQTVGYLARLRGMEHDSSIGELAKRLDVDLTRPVAALSKGNRQKVGLILALLGRPRLLLLDEPASGLDPLVQQEFYAILRERADAGATVFFSSHVLSEVQHIADQVAVIRAGRLIMLESMDAIRDKARHQIHVRFGAPPPAGSFDRIPGVGDVDLHEKLLNCTGQGSFDPLGKALQPGEGVDVNSHEADLEETFLALYGKGEQTERLP